MIKWQQWSKIDDSGQLSVDQTKWVINQPRKLEAIPSTIDNNYLVNGSRFCRQISVFIK